MEFRKAGIEDVEPLSQLFHSYRQLSVSLEHGASQKESLNWITSRLTQENGVFIIAISDDEILGFVTLYQGFSSISLNRYWVLNDLYVIEQARGLGLGRALMEQAEKYAQNTHAKGIELETSFDNTVAQSLYENLGYLENKRYKRYFKKI
ncbi:GNAT family N-acetyltransferase [Celerinatantimonas diazotrophica]|uniref:Acetyltransferase (GNAT) family protein n=1 Tax=Celerinatantimonas diazotrophica TaxID=412034 RepID=A0A4R1J9P8_9GAMM|nr:GNAT family N-acetyltransferase [Celerinatantimonas diazotrophica]TCK47343.1 acetyltransferase (GNAT) family protein [Celerinatantimonas diazotrophica]CAG9295041.1 hypothetical protein CEDIAZO_00147 [Celerinatantimonas diazotrophica]